jgi:hypothetical protein
MILFALLVFFPFVVAGLYGADHPKADLLLNGLLVYMLALLIICLVS